MSLNLLSSAYDSDDDDESAFDKPDRDDSDEDEAGNAAIEPSTSKSPEKVPKKKEPIEVVKKGSVLLGGHDETSSSESEDEEIRIARELERQNQVILERAKAAGKPSLPSAFAVASAGLVSTSSIFFNEAEREESIHNAMLSRHVAMSEKESNNQKKAGICKAFKRGNCRRGDKCRFSHYLGPPKEGPGKVEAVVSGQAEFYTDPNDVFTKRRKLV